MRSSTAAVHRLSVFDDGRVILALIVALYFLALVVAEWFGDYSRLWQYLGVPTISPIFNDLRHVIKSSDCTRLGYNVHTDNICSGDAMPYPLLWMKLGLLNLSERHTVPLGLLSIAAFFFCIWLLLPKLTRHQGLICAGLICSPSIMLAIERANVDLIVFALSVISVYLLTRKSFISEVFSWMLLLLASFLKLYPIAIAWLALHRGKVYGLMIFGSVMVVFLAYVFWNRADFQLMQNMIPEPKYWAFGAKTFANSAASLLSKFGLEISGHTKNWIYIGNITLGLLMGYLISHRFPGERIMKDNESGAMQSVMFQGGALVYLACYILASNFDYRLIFLIPTLPQIFAWQSQDQVFRWLHTTALVSVIGLSWLGFFPIGIYLSAIKISIYLNIDQIMAWILFAYLFYGVLRCTPVWLRSWLWLPGRESQT